MRYIGIECTKLEMKVTASATQPFIQGGQEQAVGGLASSIESMNSKSNLLADMFAGMAGHPGFANIVASVVQEKWATFLS